MKLRDQSQQNNPTDNDSFGDFPALICLVSLSGISRIIAFAKPDFRLHRLVFSRNWFDLSVSVLYRFCCIGFVRDSFPGTTGGTIFAGTIRR
jgi:hypothetical protein